MKTTSKPRTKKPAPAKILSADLAPETTQEVPLIAGTSPKPFSDCLKRIGEQAKDWDETTISPPAVPEAASTPEPARVVETRIENKSNPSARIWLAAMSVMVIVLVVQTVLFNMRVQELTRSLNELDATVKGMATKISAWADVDRSVATE